VVGARGIPGVEGGAEKNAENLFPPLAADHDIRLLCLRDFCAASTHRRVHIDRVSTWRLFGTDKIFYYLYSMFWTARWRPDVIHCQGLNAAFLLWFYRWTARRVVVRYGSADYVNQKWNIIGKLGFRWCEWQLRWADAVIAVTPSLCERLRRCGIGERVVVIPNAVDAIEPNPSAATLERFGLVPGTFALAVGRITWQKDFETLVRAFETARTRGSALGKLVIVGGDDGSGYLERLRTLASDRVVFTGRLPRAELAILYAACRLYVNSSRHEGLSNAILEAVSFGCPLLVSDIVENRDLPLPPRHFFKVGDAATLARKMLDASHDGAGFTADPASFATWPEVVAATRQLYDRLLSTPRSPRDGKAVPPDAQPLGAGDESMRTARLQGTTPCAQGANPQEVTSTP